MLTNFGVRDCKYPAIKCRSKSIAAGWRDPRVELGCVRTKCEAQCVKSSVSYNTQDERHCHGQPENEDTMTGQRAGQ